MTEHGIIRWERDADGIVTLTLDDPAQRVNTMTDAFRASWHDTVRRLRADVEEITGVIVTSAKETFFAGGDLRRLVAVTDENAAQFGAAALAMKAAFRTLETLGKPVVAALNGSALGGGMEIALACHHRVALDSPGARFGFPEVTLGLLPGAGGVTRSVRLLGLVDALTKLLLRGQRLRAGEALDVGIVDELATTREQLFAAARAWIVANPAAAQPWDADAYRMPGGSPSNPKLAAMLPAFPATLRKQLAGAPMPAPHHILCAAVEGASVDVDTAFTIETRYFLDLARGQVAKNMIQALWFDLNSIKAGGSRPGGYAARPATKVAVLGAGMMGAGIAYVCARAGIAVVLEDVSIEAAERGKTYSRTLLDKEIARGRTSPAEADALLARITPSADYADLAGCDLLVEAVFENAALKRRVLAEAEATLAPDALIGSNTSTLPITDLAGGASRPDAVIGLHFFSPADRMPLLEIIRGERTSDATLARALDFAAQVGKTPIVVRDSRGFFTSRVIGTFVNEALAMLGEGVRPATIEQATTQTGYPVGALQLADELNLELFVKIRDEARDAVRRAGGRYEPHPAEAVVERMIELGRPGRLRGAGFYDYRADGRRVGLWPGLGEHFPPRGDPAAVKLAELGERMLIVEAVESARCVEEGVLTSSPDANVGSIMGIGYPPWTGGVLTYINTFPGGVAGFVARADELAARHGERFRPNPLLRKKAENGERF
jgi:3-hydroxyacyl-CoA dehydrogenase/enoyl-CoA hydratase/3-hydroxybutyryl-CoA epimerase